MRKIFVHDHTPGERAHPALPKALLKWALMRLPIVTADHYIGVTEYVRTRFIQVGKIPPLKCSSAANGIVPAATSPVLRARYRALLGADASTRVIVSTGRATRYKGVETIVRTAAELIHRRGVEKLRFVYCGDGPDLADFQKLADELRLGERFLFLGQRQDVRALLQGCDLAIHASQGEVGYALSILEYMDAGLVTFVPDRESVRQCITHGRDGFVYRADDIGDLADQIQNALSNRSLSAHIGANARRTVQDYYTLARTNAQLIKILERHSFCPR